VIIRFPAPSVEGGRNNPDIGLALMMNNDDDRGGYLMRIIQYYLQDRILGLEPVNWNTRWVALSYN
jgi:hypothetical protein